MRLNCGALPPMSRVHGAGRNDYGPGLGPGPQIDVAQCSRCHEGIALHSRLAEIGCHGVGPRRARTRDTNGHLTLHDVHDTYPASKPLWALI